MQIEHFIKYVSEIGAYVNFSDFDRRKKDDDTACNFVMRMMQSAEGHRGLRNAAWLGQLYLVYLPSTSLFSSEESRAHLAKFLQVHKNFPLYQCLKILRS